MCTDCMQYYTKDIHPDDMNEITYEALKNISKKFEKGWTCCGTEFTGCKTKKTINYSDIYTIFFHDHENSFDLCLDCAKHYKIKEKPKEDENNDDNEIDDSSIIRGPNIDEN
jgi:hypothetical protein